MEELTLNPEKELKEFVRNRLKGRCAYCGSSPLCLTADHIIPVSWYKDRGRSHEADELSNLAPACKACNKDKDDKNVWKWWLKSDLWNEDRCKELLEIMLG